MKFFRSHSVSFLSKVDHDGVFQPWNFSSFDRNFHSISYGANFIVWFREENVSVVRWPEETMVYTIGHWILRRLDFSLFYDGICKLSSVEKWRRQSMCSADLWNSTHRQCDMVADFLQLSYDWMGCRSHGCDDDPRRDYADWILECWLDRWISHRAIFDVDDFRHQTKLYVLEVELQRSGSEKRLKLKTCQKNLTNNKTQEYLIRKVCNFWFLTYFKCKHL